MSRRLIAALFALAPTVLYGQATPLVVTTDWLASNLSNRNVVVVEIGARMNPGARTEHIPGARLVNYMSFVVDANGTGHELPPPDSIRSLFESVGVNDASHVVLTGPSLAATRAFFTLDYIGHPKVSILDGGLPKWKSEGRPVEATEPSVPRGHLTPRPPRSEIVASTEWVRGKIGKPGVAFFDTRTEGEYLGTDGTEGHVEGARRVEWHDYFTSPTEFALQDRQTLMRMFMERGASPVDTVIAYCAVGYRASGTYFMARLLGVPVKLYDGSYDAWSKAHMPVVKTPTPLLTRPAPANTGGGLPFVSPDGQYIAYNATRDRSQGDTYVIKADGTGEVQLTRTTAYEGAPVWLGKRIFSWSQGGPAAAAGSALITLNPDGSGATTIATIDGREFRPSPDGRLVAYVSGPWQSSRMYIANIDGSNPRAITDGSKTMFNAAWSPDGKRIAVAVMDTARQLDVGVMNADGSSLRLLTHFAKDDGSPQWPSWSPDGKTLAVQVGKYSRNQADNTAHIWLVDVATGKATKLATHDRNYLDETPSFFPDGKRIAFQSDRTGVMHVWVMNVDGTGAKQVTSWRP